MPVVSVVLPTYNRASLLPRAVASVLTQSFTDLELVVVDDGSADDTGEVVRSVNDSRVVYLRHDRNRGVAAARNTGIRAARGRLIAFQDSDDEWVQEKLALQVRSLREQGARAFSVGTVLRKLDDRVRKWSCPPEAPHDPSWAWREGAAYCQALLIPTPLLRGIGGFDESLSRWEDWDLLLRLLRVGTAVPCPQAWAVSVRCPDSLMQDAACFAEQQGLVIDRHRALLATDPARLAQLEYVTARYAMRVGDHRAAILRLRNCLRSRPGHGRAAALLAIALSRSLVSGRT